MEARKGGREERDEGSKEGGREVRTKGRERGEERRDQVKQGGRSREVRKEGGKTALRGKEETSGPSS